MLQAQDQAVRISIHALREEGDMALKENTLLIKISIHALREEGDLCVSTRADCAALFLSTPSARRATAGAIVPLLVDFDFYPRPPRGGRPRRVLLPFRAWCISIHALREEGDKCVEINGVFK